MPLLEPKGGTLTDVPQNLVPQECRQVLLQHPTCKDLPCRALSEQGELAQGTDLILRALPLDPVAQAAPGGAPDSIPPKYHLPPTGQGSWPLGRVTG